MKCADVYRLRRGLKTGVAISNCRRGTGAFSPAGEKVAEGRMRGDAPTKRRHRHVFSPGFPPHPIPLPAWGEGARKRSAQSFKKRLQQQKQDGEPLILTWHSRHVKVAHARSG